MDQIFIFKSLFQITHSDLSCTSCLPPCSSFSKVYRSNFCCLWHLSLVTSQFPGCRVLFIPLATDYRRCALVTCYCFTYTNFLFAALNFPTRTETFLLCLLPLLALLLRYGLLFLKSWPPKCPTKSCRWCKEAIQNYAHFFGWPNVTGPAVQKASGEQLETVGFFKCLI